MRVLNSNFQENKNTECNSDVYDKQMRFLHMTIGMSKILTIEVLKTYTGIDHIFKIY